MGSACVAGGLWDGPRHIRAVYPPALLRSAFNFRWDCIELEPQVRGQIPLKLQMSYCCNIHILSASLSNPNVPPEQTVDLGPSFFVLFLNPQASIPVPRQRRTFLGSRQELFALTCPAARILPWLAFPDVLFRTPARIRTCLFLQPLPRRCVESLGPGRST